MSTDVVELLCEGGALELQRVQLREEHRLARLGLVRPLQGALVVSERVGQLCGERLLQFAQRLQLEQHL